MTKLNGCKILLWDIETLPLVGFAWGKWQQNIASSQIIKDISMLCLSYKWLDSKKVHTISIGDNAKRFKADPYDKQLGAMIADQFIPVLNQADFAVAHNGDKFDYRHIKAQAVMNNLAPFKVRKVDTLKMAKTAGVFPRGNSLNDLATALGVENKNQTNFGMWADIALRSDRKQLTKMEQYCEQDVRVLEQVFLRLWPHAEAILPHIGVLQGAGRGDTCCDKCGSFDWVKNGTYIKNVLKYQRYICKDCGATFIGRKALKVEG